jgi:hypothetical protein
MKKTGLLAFVCGASSLHLVGQGAMMMTTTTTTVSWEKVEMMQEHG